MILGICSLPETMKVMRIVNIVIWIIRISVPVLLLVTGAMLYLKTMKDNDVDLPKANKTFIIKCIAAILIFLVPTFVNIIAKISGSNDFRECLDVSSMDVEMAYSNMMDKYIENATNTLNRSDYNIANNYLQNFEGEEKTTYQNKLKELLPQIIEKEKQIAQENASNPDDANEESSSGSKSSSGSGSFTSDTTPGTTSGEGKNIKVTNTVKEACKWVLNPSNYVIRLQTCSDQYQYGKPGFANINPVTALPGNGYAYTTPNGVTNYRANNTITFLDYEYGAFGGEITLYNTESYNDIFSIMYKTFFLEQVLVGYAKDMTSGDPFINSNGEYNIVTGDCFQNYRYDLTHTYLTTNATYKNTMESSINRTKYNILVDSTTGDLIKVRYNTSENGVLPIITNTSKTGSVNDILYAMGHQQNTYISNYANAVIYDCRNLQ